MKKHKGLVVSLIAGIVLLAILATVSIVYNFLGGFYYCRVIEYDKVLGEDQTVEITGEGAFVVACNFSGSLVLDVNIKQPINVLSLSDDELYLRAKAGINSFNANVLMFGYTNWVQATDGYVYFNQLVQKNENVGLCNTLGTNMQMNLKSSKNYILYFVVEASKTPYNYDVI